MRKGFSLIELIFMIVIIGIIASIAIPKLMNIRTSAVVVSLRQDISTIASSIQNYYAIHGKIDKISDTVTLNNKSWDIKDKEINLMQNNKICVSIKIIESKMVLTIDESISTTCKKLKQSGIISINSNLE
jgi:general secretion pathway protein G